MSNFLKLSKSTLLELIKEQIKNSSEDEVSDIIQGLFSNTEGSRFLWCPTNVNAYNKIDTKLILYVSHPAKKTAKIYLTTGEEITYNIIDADLLSYLEINFTNFKCLDQVNGILVNMDMIKWYDSDMNRVYFSDEHSIQVTGAAIRNIVSKIKGKEFDLFLKRASKKREEYIPMGLSYSRKLT